ncbi:MAG: protein translocase subunit SecF [Clostridia bacterium]|nr:protein translocase subunit SecF [Clostridia bacterium]
MANKTINTKKCFKVTSIIYASLIIVGIIMTIIAGAKLDISFAGGTTFSYSYTGDVAEGEFTKTVSSVLKKDFNVTQNKSLEGDLQTYVVTLSGKDAIDSDTQLKITEALEKKFAKNNIELYNADSVDASLAGTFFGKCLVAVLITAVLVVIYVAIRFRKIGGVSASLAAFCALILDLLTAFFICVIFRLPIDMNFMAVVLTILGYSLNDTIVIFDRIRENRRLYPNMTIAENVDMSVTNTMVRNIITTVTTVCAVLTIIVISEIYGLTNLRSFAIPMVFGLVSGCFSSIFISTPIWVWYKERKAAKQ